MAPHPEEAERDGHDEQRPLLADDTTPVGQQQQQQQQPPPPPGYSRRRLLLSGVLVLVAAIQGAALVNPAMNALVEGAACQQLHPEVKGPDRYRDRACKAADVQDRLAMVMGWESTWALVPALATAIPYGVFMDRRGPKVMATLVSLGGLLVQVGELTTTLYPNVFDLRGIWVASFLGNLVGGGPLGFEATQYAVASLIATEANRTLVFFYLTCLVQLNFAVSGPLVYWAMNASPVVAQLLGMALMTLSLLLTFTLPSGLTTTKHVAKAAVAPASVRQAFAKTWRASKQAATEFLQLFRRDAQLALLLVSLVFSTIGARQSLIRQQYATNRYGWTWAEAGAIISLVSLVSLLVLAVLVPAASAWLLTFKTPLGKDLFLARLGILTLLVGSLLVGLSRTTAQFVAAQAVYAMDACYPPAVTSVVASVAAAGGGGRTGLVYVTVVFMRMVGSLVAGPLVFGVFRVGLRLGGDWIGLPFFFEAALQVFTVAVTFWVRERRVGSETVSDGEGAVGVAEYGSE